VHQRIQDVPALAALGVLAEVAQDVFRGGGILCRKLRVEPLPPGVELADVAGEEKVGKSRVNGCGIGLGRTGIDERVKHHLQMVRQRPADPGDDQIPLRDGERQAIALAQLAKELVGFLRAQRLESHPAEVVDGFPQVALIDKTIQPDRAEENPAHLLPMGLPQGAQPMQQAAHALGAVILFAQCQEQLGHLVDGQQHGFSTALDLSEDALQRPAQGAVVRILRSAHFHVHAGGSHFHPAERLSRLSKSQRNPAERRGMESAFAESIDQPFGEGQFVVASRPHEEHHRLTR